MWRRCFLRNTLLALWMLPRDPLWSDDNRPGERPLIQKQPWIRFEIVLGRLVVAARQGGAWQVRQALHPEAIEGETLSLQTNLTGRPNVVLRYEQVDAQRTLTVEALERDRIEICCQPHDQSGGPAWRFCQIPHQPLHVHLGDESDGTVLSASSLWHLLWGEPTFAERCFIPILEYLRSDWQLRVQSERIVDAMVTRPRDDKQRMVRNQVANLVARLDAAKFLQRQQAERELVQLGIGTLSHLREIERQPLSREQRQRIQAVRQALTPLSADTPQRVASWLRDDRTAWLALLHHGEAETRLAARNQLEQINLVSIPFDPHGEEADRRRQLAELKAGRLLR